MSYEEWTEGPFLKLNPGEMEDKINDWNKLMYRLVQKPFKDLMNPRSVAVEVRKKLEDFRPNM